MKFLIILSLFIGAYKSQDLHPVLLVPGDGGSQLKYQFIKPPPHYICGRQNVECLLWLNLYFMLPITLDCFVKTIKLEYNITSRRTYSPDFCDVSVPGFGTVDSVSYLSNVKLEKTSYFYYIITDLVLNQGYVANKNIRGAPFDFRKSPNEMESFKRDLRNLIEEMYKENVNKSVIVIGHSLGNIYMNILLNEMSKEWKTKYINTFFSISGPYLGAVDALRTGLSGNNEHIRIINPFYIREAQSSWPSTFLLMPVPGLWGNETIVATKDGYFTSNMIPDLVVKANIPNGLDLYKDSNFILNHLTAPETSIHCIYSDTVKTPRILDYRIANFPTDQPNIIYGLGDGTVNLKSLERCIEWQKIQKEPVKKYIIPDVTHLNILRDERLVKYISGIIKTINQ